MGQTSRVTPDVLTFGPETVSDPSTSLTTTPLGPYPTTEDLGHTPKSTVTESPKTVLSIKTMFYVFLFRMERKVSVRVPTLHVPYVSRLVTCGM